MTARYAPPMPGPSAPPCPACVEGTEHRFVVHLVPDEGPSWDVTVTSIGPKGAKGVAVQTAFDNGDFDVSAVSVRHAA